MDLDEILSTTDLPAVSVDEDAALVRTLQRGRSARRRRAGVVAVAVALLIAASATAALSLSRHDERNRVSTSPVGGAQHRAVPPRTGPSRYPEAGDAAVWTADPTDPPSSSNSTFTALVRRLACNSGVTGKVLRPGVAYNVGQVIVTFTVATNHGQPATCQGNDPVRYRVHLGQRLGARDLIDGTCEGGSKAVTTSFCIQDNGVRWRH